MRRASLIVAGLVAAVAFAVPAGAQSAGVASAGGASAAATPSIRLSKGQHIYRGTGNRKLGILRLTRTARLTWRHPRGGRFRVLTKAGKSEFPLVTTVARRGTVKVRAGTYRGLRAATRGGWRITITILKSRR